MFFVLLLMEWSCLFTAGTHKGAIRVPPEGYQVERYVWHKGVSYEDRNEGLRIGKRHKTYDRQGSGVDTGTLGDALRQLPHVGNATEYVVVGHGERVLLLWGD